MNFRCFDAINVCIMNKTIDRSARKKRYGDLLTKHVEVKLKKEKYLNLTQIAQLVDSQLQQMTDNLAGRTLFPLNKIKKLVEVLGLTDEETYQFVNTWFEASLLDKHVEVLFWIKRLSKKALKGNSKYHYLNIAEHEDVIEGFLKENVSALQDESALKVLANPACLKAMSVILDLPSEKQKTLFELLETIGAKPEKLDLILGLLK